MGSTIEVPIPRDGAMCLLVGGPYNGVRRRLLPFPDHLVCVIDVALRIGPVDGAYAHYRRTGTRQVEGAWAMHFEGTFDGRGEPMSRDSRPDPAR
ncbi:hypothetical protein [Agrococcus pavilionensis]|uniref:hypothetical protein n=1 Tax=Agrococcus pavilionensis TaxID=1346502 RepID=UPI000390A1C0|nr:hypothetical protein [Agrococcus pavilionensis]